MFTNLKGGYSDLWKAIIRPPRDEYKIEGLGPQKMKIQGVSVKRTDLQIKNDRKQILECSHFEPTNRACKELPCVVYLHGNCSSRLESLNCLDVLIPQNITLFSLDLSGSGLSEGEYISLGWWEREDVGKVVQWLRESGTVSTIGLWGRSMGSVTALLHADRDPSIAGLVLDSPFSSLRLLAEDLCQKHSSIPNFVMGMALKMINSSIKDRAKFDINDLNPLKNHVDKAFIPALFVAAKGDNFIEPKHTKLLYDAYAGDKNLILVEGDHNSQRPQFMLDSVGIFFYNTLQVEHVVPKNSSDQKENKDEGESVDFSNKNKNKKIGNEQFVQQVLFGFGGGNDNHNNQDDEDEDEDEDLKRAIEESLKFSEPVKPAQKQQKNNQNQNKPSGDQDEEHKQEIEEYFMNDDSIKNNIEQNLDKNKQQISQQNKQQQPDDDKNDVDLL